VVNNAVVLIDYIKLLRSKGMGRWRSIIRGAENRLRPILMTSATTVLALLPMAMDTGEGSNLWSPLALTIVGGLFSSSVLTLFILPVIWSLVERTEGERWIVRRKEGGAQKRMLQHKARAKLMR